jgi:hypothetical protein
VRFDPIADLKAPTMANWARTALRVTGDRRQFFLENVVCFFWAYLNMKRERMNVHRIVSPLGIMLTMVLLASGGLAFGAPAGVQTVEPLRSWNHGNAKQSIIAFVQQLTKTGPRLDAGRHEAGLEGDFPRPG